jgi:hypothetical protein
VIRILVEVVGCVSNEVDSYVGLGRLRWIPGIVDGSSGGREKKIADQVLTSRETMSVEAHTQSLHDLGFLVRARAEQMSEWPPHDKP